MVKIFNCYLYAKKKSYGTLSKGAIFFGHPCMTINVKNEHRDKNHLNALDL